jgi:sporulation protein YlmC with PRC-barrel domain
VGLSLPSREISVERRALMTTKDMTEAEAHESHGRTIVASDGQTIGKVSEIYLDDRTQKPEWATVAGGALGANLYFVPLVGAFSDGDNLHARVTMEQVKHAPSLDADGDGHLSEQEEARLFEHYGIPYANDGLSTTQSQSGDRGLGGGARLRRYIGAENLTPVVGSVRTAKWTRAI